MSTITALTCDCFEYGDTCFHGRGKQARRIERRAYLIEADQHPLDYIPPIETWIDLDDRRYLNRRYNACRAKG